MALAASFLGAVVIASAASDVGRGAIGASAPDAVAVETGAAASASPGSPPLISFLDGAILLSWSAASLALLSWWRGWRPGHLDGPAWRPAAAVGLAAAVFIIGAGLLGAFAARLLWPASLGGGSANAQSISVGAAQVVAAAAVLAMRRGLFERTSGHPASGVSALFGGAVGLLVVWPLIQIASLAGAGLHRALNDGSVPMVAHESLRQIQQDPGGSRSIVIIVTALAVAPFVEEVLYRGVLQQLLKSAGLRRGVAIGMSAGIFAIMHLGENAVDPAGAWAALPALFVLGVALGVLYERTGRLAAPIVAHALFNAVNLLMLLGRSSPTLAAP